MKVMFIVFLVCVCVCQKWNITDLLLICPFSLHVLHIHTRTNSSEKNSLVYLVLMSCCSCVHDRLQKRSSLMLLFGTNIIYHMRSVAGERVLRGITRRRRI